MGQRYLVTHENLPTLVAIEAKNIHDAIHRVVKAYGDMYAIEEYDGKWDVDINPLLHSVYKLIQVMEAMPDSNLTTEDKLALDDAKETWKQAMGSE